MSLINDALKKAQKLRTGETAPPPPAPERPGVRIAKRPHPVPVRTMVICTTGAIALLVTAVATTAIMMSKPALVLALRKHSHATKPATAAPSTTAGSQANALTGGIKVPGLSPPATPPVAAVIPPPAPPPATPEPAAPETTAPPAKVAATVPVAPKPAAVISVTSPDPKIIAFLDTLKIAGIRVSDANSKVLMNDRVFRLNEIVDQSLGLKLTGVAADLLTFVDQRGVVYTKDF